MRFSKCEFLDQLRILAPVCYPILGSNRSKVTEFVWYKKPKWPFFAKNLTLCNLGHTKGHCYYPREIGIMDLKTFRNVGTSQKKARREFNPHARVCKYLFLKT